MVHPVPTPISAMDARGAIASGIQFLSPMARAYYVGLQRCKIYGAEADYSATVYDDQHSATGSIVADATQTASLLYENVGTDHQQTVAAMRE